MPATSPTGEGFEVLDPTHEEQPTETRRAARLSSLEGAVVGIISNGLGHSSIATTDLCVIGTANSSFQDNFVPNSDRP